MWRWINRRVDETSGVQVNPRSMALGSNITWEVLRVKALNYKLRTSKTQDCVCLDSPRKQRNGNNRVQMHRVQKPGVNNALYRAATMQCSSAKEGGEMC